MFRLSPSRFFPYFCPPFLSRLSSSCSHCHFPLVPLSGCFPWGNHPWTHSIFLRYVMALAPLHGIVKSHCCIIKLVVNRHCCFTASEVNKTTERQVGHFF